MDPLERAAAAVRALEDGSAEAPSSASSFVAELGRGLQDAGTPEGVHLVLARARQLWSASAPGGQALLEAVSWDLLPLVAPYASLSRSCQASVADISLDIAGTCAPREAVTILLAALGSGDEEGELPWGLRLALVQGLARALPAVPRRRLETFQQAALALLHGLRAATAAPSEAGRGGEVAQWAAEQYLEAVLHLTGALLARLQPEEDKLRESLARFSLHILVSPQLLAVQRDALAAVVKHIDVVTARVDFCHQEDQRPFETFRDLSQRSGLGLRFSLFDHLLLCLQSICTAELPMAAPSLAESAPPTVPPLLLASLHLLPLAGLDRPRILDLRIDVEAAPEDPASDSDEDGGGVDEEHAEVELGRALAACYLLCLPPASLPRPPPPPLSARDRVGAVALAGRLLHGASMLGSKGLALIAAAAAGERHEMSDPLEQDLVDGVQATLQSLTLLMLMLPEPRARQAAYGAFKAGLSVLPPSERLFTLQRFIDTCPHQPVVSLLLHLLKEEVARALPLPPSPGPSSAAAPAPQGEDASPRARYRGERILQVVDHVLCPQDRGGPPVPELPREADVVMGALNLYRFLLLREAAVGASWSGALSAESLQHARSHWLLPLRGMAAQAAARSKRRAHREGQSTQAGKSHEPPGSPNPVDDLLIDAVQEVLHRVLEIVEDRLQQEVDSGIGTPVL